MHAYLPTYIHTYIPLHYITLHSIRLHYIHAHIYIYILFIYIPKFVSIAGFSKTSCLLSLSSWLSHIISCYVLAATILAFEHYFSWLSNIAPYTVFVAAPLLTFKYAFLLHFAAILLAFQHNYLFFVAALSTFKLLLWSCCYALGFPTKLPTTFLLRGSCLSTTNSPCYVCCCNAPDFLALLPVGCCYAFDFQSILPTTFLLLHSWLSNITSPLLLLRSWLSNITS